MDENAIPEGIEKNNVDSPGKQLLLILISVGLGLFIGQMIGLIFLASFYDSSMDELARQLHFPFQNNHLRWPLLVLQAVVSLFTFLFFPLLLTRLRGYVNLKRVFSFNNFSVSDVFLLLAITIVTMGVASGLGELSKNIVLPDFLSWMQSKDSEIEKLMVYLTTFDSIPYLITTIIVIAIIPAVGEEFLFRGLIQRNFIKVTNSHHWGIWVTAFIFGAIHLQFFGLLPRMFIGVVLGYCYVWTRSLVYPIIIHLLNNGITIILLFLYQKELIATDVETATLPAYIVILLMVLLVSLLVKFRKLKVEL